MKGRLIKKVIVAFLFAGMVLFIGSCIDVDHHDDDDCGYNCEMTCSDCSNGCSDECYDCCY